MNKTVWMRMIAGVFLYGFSAEAGKVAPCTGNPVTLAADGGCRNGLRNRSDSVSYAVGLLLGQEIERQKNFSGCNTITRSGKDNPEASAPNEASRK